MKSLYPIGGPSAGVARSHSIFEALENRTFFSAGSLDPTFGDGGIVLDSGLYGQINDTVVLDDGKILAAGVVGEFTGSQDFFLARYNSDGTPDTSFGDGNGHVILDLQGDDDIANALVVQSDGKILVGGISTLLTDRDYAVVRFESDGSVDDSYGADGSVFTDFGKMNDRLNAMALQSDGKLVVAGSGRLNGSDAFGVARYDSDGVLDPTFGTGGQVWVEMASEGGARAMALASDGKILLAGGVADNDGDIAMVRLDDEGDLDNSFDNNGIVRTNLMAEEYDPGQFTYSTESAETIAIQADGKLIVSGGWTVLRYNDDGSLDTTFGGGDGWLQIHDFNEAQTELVLLDDGSMIVAGEAEGTDRGDFVVAKLRPDGSRDNSFGGRGIAVIDIGQEVHTSLDRVLALEVDPDGNILVSGLVSEFTDGESTDRPVMVRYLGSDEVGSDPAPVVLKSSGTLVATGTAGDDEILMTSGGDLLIVTFNGLQYGFIKDEITSIRVYGNDGEDVIQLPPTIAPLYVLGGNGNDSITVVGGNAVIKGEAGNDTIIGESGTDRLYGGDGDDHIDGGGNADFIDGGIGNDRLEGGSNEDTLRGREGNDTLIGGTHDDQLYGDAGNDKLYGQDGDDYLHGGDGDDILNAGIGTDILYGRAGNDRFHVLGSTAQLFGGGGTDSAEDVNGDDVLVSIEQMLV